MQLINIWNTIKLKLSFISMAFLFSSMSIYANEIIGLPNTLCIGASSVTLTTSQGNNGSWNCATAPGALSVNSGTSTVFDPTVAGLGTHIIVFGAGTGNECSASVEIFNSGVTLDPFDNVCISNASFALTGGDPVGGTYSGTGVDASGNFSPSAAGAGTHTITYTNPDGCMATEDITVIALPNVTLDPFDVVCEDDGVFTVTGATPAGGAYSGTGISGNLFDPSVSGTGTFEITYTYNDGTCTSSDSENLTVEALPSVTMTGLNSQYCDNSPTDYITGSPAGGVFTGNYVTQLDASHAEFSPIQAGAGTHTVTYTYTSPNGCTNSVSQEVQVGTQVTITGLEASYCADQAPVEIIGTPINGSFNSNPAMAGLSDNGDGTAILDPTIATPGTYTIEYEYTNSIGCVNSTSQTIEINPLPTPGFAGLQAEYCENDAADLLAGNYSPSGNFYGDGITDNGDGTASFDPSLLIAGGPYTITYTYTDGNACTASATKQTSINPLPGAVLSGDATICYNATTPIQIEFTGTAPYNFSFSNGFSTTIVDNHGTDTYIKNVSPTNTTSFSMVSVTDDNGCSNTGTGTATINVNPNLVIITQPSDKTVCNGANTSFTVEATGVDVTYQWTDDGGNVVGTNSVLTLNNVTPADVGGYRCEVSSTCGGPIISNTANLSLFDDVSINTHPSDDYLCSGEDLILTVNATGANLSFQWRKDGVDIPGANLSTYQISEVTSANVGSYTCFVDGSCNSYESDPAKIKIDAPITITSQPTDKSACEGSNTSFTVTATGTSLNYQWQKDGVDTGITSQSLIFNGVVAGDAGDYRCVISSPCGAKKTTSTATLTVKTSPVITTNPSDKIQCEGDNISFNVAASGSDLTYQWQKDGVDLSDDINIAGSETSQLILSSLLPEDGGAYQCVVSGACGSKTSTKAVLAVDDNISISKHPADKNLCQGANTTLSVTASGSNLAYQWYKNAGIIPGETDSEFQINSADQIADQGDYYCMISNTCGQIITSNASTVNINPLLSITGHPTDAINCEGEDISFKVAATGTNLNYQWFRNNTALTNTGNISGALSKTLIISGILVSDAGTYHCEVTSDCGNQKSNPAHLIVDDNITINSEPTDTTICIGDNVSFLIEANGSNILYQWQKDGTDIPGETNPTLNLNNVDAAAAGAYRCNIENSCGNSVTSQPAVVSFYTATSISQHPTNTTQCEGTGINFSVAAAGSNLTYQWQKNGSDLSDNANISGANAATLSISSVSNADEGIYMCIVTGSCGTENSNPASLVVEKTTQITLHPKNIDACPGNEVTFNVSAEGTNLSYQWQIDNNNIPGETTTSIHLSGLTDSDAGVYRCIVSGNCGSVNSNGASLAVFENTVISTQPLSDVLCEDEQASFDISVTGTNLSYQWKNNGNNLIDDAYISGSKTANLSIESVTTANAGIYECLVSGSCGNVLSNGVTLEVNEKTVITTHPENKSACPGDNSIFNVTATGSNLSYQWQHNNTDSAGAVNSSLLINQINTSDEGEYKCIVTGSCGEETSQIATLDVFSKVTISEQPGNDTVCEGENAALTVLAVGDGPITYQWKRNAIPLSDNLNINGSNTNSLSLAPVSLSDQGTYNCEITGICGSRNSDPAKLEVQEKSSILTQPTDLTVCENDNALLSISATGSGLKYQWQKNGSDILGANTPDYTIMGVSEADEGTYRCLIYGSCDTLYSDGAYLSVNQNAFIAVQPPALTSNCEGGNITISLTASGSNLTYQWMRGGIDLINDGRISGAKSNNLYINGVEESDDGIYTCKVTGSCNFEISNLSELSVKKTAEITQQPTDFTVASGENATFSITAEGTGLLYQWQVDGTNLNDGGNISGANTAVLSLNPATETNAGAYHCIVTADCNSINSAPANLIVNSSTIFLSHPQSKSKCAGESASFSVTTSAASPVFQWKVNGTTLVDDGTHISGAQTANLNISAVNTADAGAYTCVVNGESSAPANLVVNVPVTINSQPSSRELCEGNDVSFSVNASGSISSYQWQLDNNNLSDINNISGSSSNTLIISDLSDTDEGNYRCLVTGTCGIYSSDPATLTVNKTTVITVQPSPDTLCEGNSMSFGIVAEGEDLNYKWKKGGTPLSDNENINGSSSDHLSILSVSETDAGSYYCSVSGACGNKNSNIAALTIRKATQLNLQPTDLTACQEDNVSFSVNADGHNLSYQWQKEGVDLNNSDQYNGVNSNFLSIKNVSESDGGSFRCNVMATCDSVFSESAVLNVYDDPVITQHPENDTVCKNGQTSFSVNATGTDITFQWNKNGTPLVDGNGISGSATENLVITNASQSDAGIYTCLVSGNCNASSSNPATLVIKAPLQIINQPEDFSGCAGETFSLVIVAEGSELTYQWQKNNTDIINSGNITGAQTSHLKISNPATTDAGAYHCIISGYCGTKNSDASEVMIYKPASMAQQPLSDTVCEGTSLSFSANANGDNLSYQWLMDGDPIQDTGFYKGVDQPILNLTQTTQKYEGAYSIEVTGICNTVKSNSARAEIQENTVIKTQPTNKKRCAGEYAVFTITATGENITYRWQKDGVDLTEGGDVFGVNTNSLSIYNLTPSDNGYYRCIINSSCAELNSNEASLTVTDYPDPAGSIIGMTEVCQGESGIIYEIPSIANADYYQWQLPQGMNLISGDSTRAIIAGFSDGEIGGEITVRGVNACGAGTPSPPLKVNANPSPVANAGSDQNICNSSTTLNASDPGMANGTWSVINGPGLLADSMLHNTSAGNLRKGENVFVWTVSQSGCSSFDTVSVFNNSVSANAGVDVTLCSGSITLEGNEIPSGATGMWQVVSGKASFGNAGLPNSTATDFSNGENHLKWTLSKSGCYDSDTVLIDNQTPSIAFAGINQNLCSDSTFMQGNNPLIGVGSWSVITGTGTIEQPSASNTKITNIKKGDNIFRWTISNGICESIDEVTITNNMLNVEAGKDQVICDRSTELTAASAESGQGVWSVLKGSAVFVNSNSATTIVTSLSYGENILKWNIEKNGCLSYDTVRITNDSPSSANAGKDQEISVDSTRMEAEEPSIGSGQWLVLSGAAVFEDPYLYNTRVSNIGVGENKFRWIVSNNSCTSSDDVIINYIYETITDAGPDQELCQDYTTLEGNEPLFGFGQWSVVKGSAIFTDNSDPKTTITNLGKGENILRWTIWENDYNSDDVSIFNNTPTTPYAGSDQVICSDTAALNANAPAIGSGYWSVISGSADFSDTSAFNSKAFNFSMGTNTLKWTISNKGCELHDLVTVVNDQPSEAIAGDDQILCTDSTVLLPESPTVGTGEWGVVSGSAIFDENRVSALASGTNMLRWTVTNNNCKTSDDLLIINNMPTKARAGSDKVICVDSVTMKANEPVVGIGKWTTLNGAAIFDNESAPDAKITNIALGTNVFRWTVEHEGCISVDETEIKYLYEASYAGEDQTLCSNSTILNAESPSLAKGYWSVVGGSGTAIFENPQQPDTKVTGLDYGKNTLQWIVQNDICKAIDEVVITNNLPNDAYAGADQSVCGTTATLNAGEPGIGEGTWSILGGSGLFADSSMATTEITNLSFGSNTLRWTIEHKGCMLTDDVVIFNNSVTASNAGEDQVVCNDTAQLNANLPLFGKGEWMITEGAAIFEDQNKHNTKISHLAQGKNMLTWHISNGQCESENNVIIINNKPSMSIAGSDQDVCGKEAVLNANKPDIGSGKWKLISGGGEVINNTLASTEVKALNPGANVFRWTITNEGCISYDEVTINNNIPFEANAGTDITICGPETRLFANNPGSATGSWSIISGNAIFSDPNSHNPDLYNIGFGENTFEWKIEFEECTTSDVVIITNNKTPVNAGADQVVNTSATTLVASNPTSGTGTWSVIGGNGLFENPEKMITKVNNIGSGKNTYLWSVDVNGCVSSDEVIVTYEAPAIASFVTDISEGCPPLDVYFVNNSFSNLPFKWDFDDNTTSDQVSVMHTFTEPGYYNVSLTVYGDKGEIVVKDTLIHVYDQPKASFMVSEEEIFIPDENAIFINESQNTISYLWDFGDGHTSTEKDPFHTYEEEGTYDVSMIAWTTMNCSDTMTVEDAIRVETKGNLQFPNAFTPSLNGPGNGTYSNNDYSNDVFHPYGDGIAEYHLEIFNKWGILLFESFEINIGWDGYYKGELVSKGAYIWKVSGKYNDGKRFIETGTIMVLH